MISGYALQQLLFLDIETVPQQENYAALPENWKQLWDYKAGLISRNREVETPASIYDRAGIYAEFGKIICISCGVIQESASGRRLIIKSFAGHHEKLLLRQFSDMLQKWSNNDQKYLCAHNGKDFDFPYICRRLIINGMPLPALLNIAGKKPWEIRHLDTMELWKFGDLRYFISLNLLAQTLGIPTPKDDIDGSMVAKVYYEEKNMDRIIIYCQKDVITLAQVFLKFSSEPLIAESDIEIK